MYSDDSALLLALGATFVESNGFQPKKCIEFMNLWRDTAAFTPDRCTFGLGGAIGGTLAASKNIQNIVAQPTDINQKHLFDRQQQLKAMGYCGYGAVTPLDKLVYSGGNGVLMRHGPVAAAAYKLPLHDALTLSDHVVATTYFAQDTFDMARLFTFILHQIINNQFNDKSHILELLADKKTERLLNLQDPNSHIFFNELLDGTLLQRPQNWFTEAPSAHKKSWEYIKNRQHWINVPRTSGWVIPSFELALWSFFKTNSFETCLNLAISCGYDTDTIGSIAGQIAGAFYGYQKIPPALHSQVANHENIMGLTRCLYELAPKMTIENLEKNPKDYPWVQYTSFKAN
jgi:ADP-ribosylglycohydrolase